MRAEVEELLGSHATIGAEPVVGWARYKQVAVEARVVVRADENPDAVRSRILARLAASITPVPDRPTEFGSDFGRPLRVSNLYRALEESEPGVRFVDRVLLHIDETPDVDAVGLVHADGQPDTWFTAQGGTLFRTTNSGDGWEAVKHFGDEPVRAIVPWSSAPAGRSTTLDHPGLVAVATGDSRTGSVHVSDDLGGTWRQVADMGFGVADLAWIDRGGDPHGVDGGRPRACTSSPSRRARHPSRTSSTPSSPTAASTRSSASPMCVAGSGSSWRPKPPVACGCRPARVLRTRSAWCGPPARRFAR